MKTHPIGTALSLALISTLAGVASCYAENAPVPRTVPRPASVAHMADAVCQQPHLGDNMTCKLKDLTINTYPDGCSTDGFYGVVQAPNGGKAALHESLPASDANVVARFMEGQFVCVSADARGLHDAEPSWYYITAIPVATLKACKGNPDCKPGDLPVEWVKAHGSEPCRPGPDKRYIGDCAAGWVKASEFGEYSMGI